MDAIFSALAHPIRRRILELLKGGGMTAGALAEAFPVAKPTMSAHFAKLKDAGLIQGETRGTSTIYTLNLSVMEDVLLGFMSRVGRSEEEACPIVE